jgi:hypothetical protein
MEVELRRGTNLLATAIALVVATTFLPASAHHSYAMFDVDKKVSVEGTVKQFMWTNPHSWIRLEVMDTKGQPKEWSVEMGSLTILVGLGWNPKTLLPGDKIRITVHPMKSGLAGGDFVSLESGGHSAIKNDGGAQERLKERAAHQAGNT